MNSNRATPKRLNWTTVALNFCFPLVRSLENMRVKHKTPTNKLAKGTLADCTSLADFIQLSVSPRNRNIARAAKWEPNFFYTTRMEASNDGRPSDQLEASFNNIADYLKKNKTMLMQVDDAVDLIIVPEVDLDENYPEVE